MLTSGFNVITKEAREEMFARVEENPTQKIPRIYLEVKNCFPSGIPSGLSHSGQSLQEEVRACTKRSSKNDPV